MENSNYLHSELTSKVLRAFFNVYNELGFGFLEKVYERALFYEIERRGLTARRQNPIEVFYKKRKY